MTGEFPMGPADSLFLEHERRTPEAVNTIGAFLRFRGAAPEPSEFRSIVAQRMAEFERFRLVQAPLARRRPRWRPVPGFDLRQNTEVVHAQGGLTRTIGRLAARRLPTDTPPWRVTMVTGYDPGEFAVLISTHHALLDGASISMWAALLFGQEEVPISPDGRGPDWISGTARGLAAAAKDIASRSHPLHDDLVLGEERHLTVAVVPRSLVAAARDAAIGESRPTVNDVYLAAASGAMRNLLLSSGSRLPRTVHAGVPVNIRSAESLYMLGNGLSFLRVTMPLAQGSAAVRLAAVSASIRRAKGDNATEGNVLLAETFARAGGSLLAAFARFGLSPRITPLICSNVPVPDVPFAFAGRPHLQSAGVPFLPHRHGVSVVLVTSGSDFTISVLADPRLEDFADLLAKEIEAEFGKLANPAPPLPNWPREGC